MKIVLCLALLCCIIVGIESNCSGLDEHTREAYCSSVYAFVTKVKQRLPDRNNFYVYELDTNVIEDFKNLRKKDGAVFEFEFEQVYVDKNYDPYGCTPLKENTEFLLMGKKKDSKTLKIVAGKGQARKWENIQNIPIFDWLNEIPSCPMPQDDN